MDSNLATLIIIGYVHHAWVSRANNVCHGIHQDSYKLYTGTREGPFRGMPKKHA